MSDTPVKVRLFANPTRPNSAAAGGAAQVPTPAPAPTPTSPTPPSTDKAIIVAAAKLYGISAETLWGVYGTESAFGANTKTSSAGAKGPFQFLDGTAKQYGVDVSSLQSSALGAARYLHDLGADSNPDSAATAAALNSYSGNGGATYVAKVKDNGKTLNGGGIVHDVTGAIGGAAGAVTGAITDAIPGFGAVSDAAGFIGKAFGLLTSADTWLRIGKFIMGGALVLIGTGALVFVIANKASGGSVGKAAKSAGKDAVVAAAL